MKTVVDLAADRGAFIDQSQVSISVSPKHRVTRSLQTEINASSAADIDREPYELSSKTPPTMSVGIQTSRTMQRKTMRAR